MTRPATDADPIGNATFYTVFARAHGEIRPFLFEGPMIQTQDEVLAAIDQFPKGYSLWCVIRHDYDLPRRDVTEDIARTGYENWARAHDGWNSLPHWPLEHMPSDLDSGYRGNIAAE